MGLPLVTKAGDRFAARVGASLPCAVGLPELVARSEADHEALIPAPATDPARRGAIRARLKAARGAAPLFSTARHTRHVEAALCAVAARGASGLAPVDIEAAAATERALAD